MIRKPAHRGQALVLVLLSLAVVLTLVLFVLARSTTDIAISSRSEEATRAFSAAEAGIENALIIGAGESSPVDVGNNSRYTSEVSSFAENSTEFNYPIELAAGESMTVWFVDHNADGTIIENSSISATAIDVCWGASGLVADSSSPAVEVSVFYEEIPGDKSSIRIGRATYDPYVGRNPANNFSLADVGCGIGGASYSFHKNINLPGMGVNQNGLLFARVRMFYNSTYQKVGIRITGNSLPSQGQDVSSTGSAVDSSNNVRANRKVNVFQTWPEPPAVFDFAIYSGQGLTK